MEYKSKIMGHCICKKVLTKDKTSDVEVSSPLNKSKSTSNLPTFNKTVLPSSKQLIDLLDPKRPVRR